jgi:dTDP-4-dehydrorhamnose 3,5-epimerase-like enzyme
MPAAVHSRGMFKRWYKAQKFRTQQQCADALQLHKSTICRMLKDESYRPDRLTAMHIERMTEGKVPATSWRGVAA